MKYTITDGNQLFELAAEFSLKPAASVLAIVAAILQRDADVGTSHVSIEIDLGLVSSSYGRVPATFAQALNRSYEIEYTEVQSFLKTRNRKDYLCIAAGAEKVPTSFRARAKQRVAQDGEFKIKKRLVPRSYRLRPALLTAVLTEELGQPICNRCKGKFLIWKLDKQN